jgi:hypothetical protein
LQEADAAFRCRSDAVVLMRVGNRKNVFHLYAFTVVFTQRERTEKGS